MREWLIMTVGGVIGITIGILIGEAFEVSRIAGKLIALSCTVGGAGLAMGIATMAGWVKPLSNGA
jgi:hypothetical protein